MHALYQTLCLFCTKPRCITTASYAEAFAQPAPPACKVNADCKNGTLTTCCLNPDGPGVCIDGAKQECLTTGEACDKASVCTAGSFVKSCCPPGVCTQFVPVRWLLLDGSHCACAGPCHAVHLLQWEWRCRSARHALPSGAVNVRHAACIRNSYCVSTTAVRNYFAFGSLP